jgi:hypothetical protein
LLTLLAIPSLLIAVAHPRPAPAMNALHSVVLVELFTSEGCSSCPPADELLQQINGRSTPEGQLIVGISEHVSYWDSLGWKDPFSSEFYTNRQSEYSQHFGLGSVYTPQMVVNGREQFVGGDRRALTAAFSSEASRRQIQLHITAAQVKGNQLTFSYSAADLPPKKKLQLFAVLVDDSVRSSVHRGENSGRELSHVSVARVFASMGALHPTEQQSLSLSLPTSFNAKASTGHHLILFAQRSGAGGILGVDTRPI